MSAGLRMEARSDLKRRQDIEYAEALDVVAEMCRGLADALREDDGILGCLSGRGLAANLPALPKHIRDVFVEYLSDEAALSYRADLAYLRASVSASAETTPNPEGGAS